MNRWNGVLKIQLHPDSNTYYRIAASLGLSPSNTSFAVPSGNAIFFHGDRVEGTNNPMIERLSDPQKITEILVAKFGGSVNAYVVEASIFNGPFAIYKDFIPSISEYGEPKSYDATGFPASTSLVSLLSKFLAEAKEIIFGKQKDSYRAEVSVPVSYTPQVALLGFSKGGTVLNQLITEFSFSEFHSTPLAQAQGNKNTVNGGHAIREGDWIIPTSKENLFSNLTEVHYVDVGLNTEGAYLTDKDVIERISKSLIHRASGIRFIFHGTPRQWCDERRQWIRKEKDAMVSLLKKAAQRHMGKLQLRERFYFPGKLPDLQMHFEVLDILDTS